MAGKLKFRQGKEVIRIPSSPPVGAVMTGERVMFGGVERPVYRSLKPQHLRAIPKDIIGDDGKPMRRLNYAGQPIVVNGGYRNRTTLEFIPEDHPDAWEEYILYSDGRGSEFKMRDFREDPEAVARREREAKAKKFSEDLAAELLAADMTPAEFIAALKQQREAEGQEPTDEDFTGVKKVGRYFVAYANGEKLGKGTEDEETAQALLQGHMQAEAEVGA